MSVFRSLVFLCGMLVAGHVWALPDVPTIAKITAVERDKVQAIFTQQQRNFGETCAAVKVVRATAINVAEPLVLDAKGKPSGGHWRVRYGVDACGLAAVRTVDMQVAGQGIAIEALAPGDTLADGKLQADVQRSLTMAGHVAMPKCTQDVVVRDTKVRFSPAGPNQRWQELWIGGMCGRDLGQVVDFLPTKNGTTFKMSLPKAAAK